MSILAIDVGNTRVKFALCTPCSDGLPTCDHWVASPASDLNQCFAALDKASDLDPQTAQVAIAGSNTKLLDEMIDSWPAQLASPTVIREWSQSGLSLKVDNPQTVGMDRLLNAVGASSLRPDGATIVVDSGTATTIDLVVNNAFLGGAILPGLQLASRALHDHTAALPEIDPLAINLKTTLPLGKDTPGAISAGVLFGQVGAIREIVQRYQVLHIDAKLLFTGGAAERLSPAFPDAQLLPHLCLRALATLV